MKQPIQNQAVEEASPQVQSNVPEGLPEDRINGIPIPASVWRGIEAVRRSGLTNMLDRNRVAQLAGKLKHPEAKRWVKDNPRKYAEGVFCRFIVEPQVEKS